jgi:hypothetical protein
MSIGKTTKTEIKFFTNQMFDTCTLLLQTNRPYSKFYHYTLSNKGMISFNNLLLGVQTDGESFLLLWNIDQHEVTVEG